MSVRSVLVNMGYRPIDAQEWWRCQALYRDGGSNVSLAVHKRTGRFVDHVSKQSGSLKTLVELTTKEKINDFEEYLEDFDIELKDLENDRPSIMSERIWGEEELDTVFPHYKFYEDRGINKETLKNFKSGLQHTGTLNRRYVFPIFNKDGKIHGWTGRDMTNVRDVKWHHVGSTKNWIYPYYMKMDGIYPCQDEINRAGYVILVESIGDMLALWDRGYKNVLVTFGTNISKKMCTHLMGLGKRVVISTNNDLGKPQNWGARAAVKIYIELMKYISFQNLIIALPVGANDFGEGDHDFKGWKEKVDNPNMEGIHKFVLKEMRDLYSQGKLSKTSLKIAKALAEEYDEEYN